MLKKITAYSILILLFLLNIGTISIAYNGFNKNNDYEQSSELQTTKEKHIEMNGGISTYLSNNPMTVYDSIKNIIPINGWTKDLVYLKSSPNQNSQNLCFIPFNMQIEYYDSDEDWIKIKYNNKIGYVKREYISDIKCSYEEYFFPYNTGFKSYLPYNKITHTESRQYELQKYAYTGTYGIRQVNGRFCIAVGTAFNVKIGDYADLILTNGEIIPIIISDIKADIHTNSDNITTTSNGCVSEFVVDMSILNEEIKIKGDISKCDENWNSSVASLRVYNKNILIWD